MHGAKMKHGAACKGEQLGADDGKRRATGHDVPVKKRIGFDGGPEGLDSDIRQGSIGDLCDHEGPPDEGAESRALRGIRDERFQCDRCGCGSDAVESRT